MRAERANQTNERTNVAIDAIIAIAINVYV